MCDTSGLAVNALARSLLVPKAGWNANRYLPASAGGETPSLGVRLVVTGSHRRSRLGCVSPSSGRRQQELQLLHSGGTAVWL